MTARSRVLLVVVVLAVVVGGAGFWFLTRGDGDSSPASASLSEAAPTPTESVQNDDPEAEAKKVSDLGTLSGVETIDGPEDVDKDAKLRFQLTGPERFSETVTKAPWEIELDTKKLKNGEYELVIRSVVDDVSTIAERATLTIKNAKAKPSATKSPDAKPSATKKPTPKPSGSTKPSTPPEAKGFAAEVVSLTNKERAKAKCGKLKADATLTKVAQAHSADMAKKDYFSHESKDGRSPFQRMTDAGYTYSAAAENIAAGQRTAADVVKGWMNSPGHKANILNCDLTEIGVGYATGGSYGVYWTQDFGKP